MMAGMAGKVPLFLAAALFVVGAGGFLVTMPGQDTVGAFVPVLRARSTPTASVPAVVREPSPPTIEVATSVADEIAIPDVPVAIASLESPTSTAEPSPTPTPHRAGAVAAAVASDALEDPDATPTRGPLRAIMVARDTETVSPEGGDAEVEPTTAADSTPQASADVVEAEASPAE